MMGQRMGEGYVERREVKEGVVAVSWTKERQLNQTGEGDRVPAASPEVVVNGKGMKIKRELPERPPSDC